MNLVIFGPPGAGKGTQSNFIAKKFNLIQFSKLISRNSKTQVIMIQDYKDIENYFKKNLISNEIIIGMGAGSISKYMRELKTIL